MSNCANLATKEELQALEQRLLQELKEKANTVQLQPLKAGIAEATAVGIAAKAASELFNQQAQTKIAKASFDAALAGKKAAKALSTGTSALGKATQALGNVASVVSLLGSFASLAAVAALTKRVTEHRKDFLQYKEKTDKELQRIAFIAKNAYAYTQQNREQLEKHNEQIASNRRTANEALHLARTNKTQIEQLKKDYAALNSRIKAQNQDFGELLKSVNERLSKQSVNNQDINKILNQNRNLADRVNDFSNLRNDVINIETKYRNLQSNYPNLQNDVRANTQVRTRVLTGVESLKLRQNIIENQITDITSQQNQVGQSPTFESIDGRIKKQIDEKVPELVKQEIPKHVDHQKLNSIDAKLALAIPAIALLPLIWNKLQTTPAPTPCQAPVLVPPVRARVEQNIGLTNTLQGVTIAQNEVTRRVVNATKSAVDASRAVLNTVNNTLNQTKGFIETAWSFTKMDKVLNVLNLAVNLHNATMLSREIGETLGDAISNALNTVGIKDAEGSPIDFNELFTSSVSNLISSIIGTENYQALLTKFAKANRIYQTGMNLLSSVRNMIDATTEVAEIAAENIGVVGNALKRAGAIRENAFPNLPERVDGQSRFIRLLEKAEETVDTLENITGETLEISEEISQIKEDRQELKEQIEDFVEEKDKQDKKDKDLATNTPEPKTGDELEAIDE